MDTEFMIGDWITPTDPIIDCINYGFNNRLIIEISTDGTEFTTTCEAFGIEKNRWDMWNTEFAGRVVIPD
jgi:hypothetical protein